MFENQPLRLVYSLEKNIIPYPLAYDTVMKIHMEDRGKKFVKCSDPKYDLTLYTFFYDLYQCGMSMLSDSTVGDCKCFSNVLPYRKGLLQHLVLYSPPHPPFFYCKCCYVA